MAVGMRSGLALVGLAMMGCGPQHDQPPAGAFLDVRIDATAVPVFHHLDLYYGDGFMDPRPIATPAVLAGNEPPAEDATSWSGGHVVRIDHGQSYRYTKWQLTGFSHPIYIGVAAVDRSGHVLAGGSSGPIDGPTHLAITIALDPSLRPELWGSPQPYAFCDPAATSQAVRDACR